MSGIPAHNTFAFDDGVTFTSDFDNGNMSRAEKLQSGRPYDYKIWTAPDNYGTPYQSKNCFWFHFLVTGLPAGVTLRIQIGNASNHSGLYKYDMRPVYRSNSNNQKWTRLRNSVRFVKQSNESAQLYFEHQIETTEDKLYFAFTYPYSYTNLQQDLRTYDELPINLAESNSIYYHRELLTNSCDGRRVDLLTISSVGDELASAFTELQRSMEPTTTRHCNLEYLSRVNIEREPLLSGLFPDELSCSGSKQRGRPPLFAGKPVVFVSARVHPGEVPAQHTFNGLLQLLLDPNDVRARELRKRFVFKLVPMINPDGVFRGHCRMDQHGDNLNRYYINPDPAQQPSIFAIKSLLDYYSEMQLLTVYLDFHAHASKRGCFIYGNVVDDVTDQIQNQLFCRLMALNSPHFDYDGCLFSRDHMTRIDPGDYSKGLTAEGSGRVNTYLQHGLIHSYTLECNYNTGRICNEVPPTEFDCGGKYVTPPTQYSVNCEKYTPSSFASVGRSCLTSLLDILGINPCSRIPKSKFRSLERLYQFVAAEVRGRKEYKLQTPAVLYRDRVGRVVSYGGNASGTSTLTVAEGTCNSNSCIPWKRAVERKTDENSTDERSSSVPREPVSTSSSVAETVAKQQARQQQRQVARQRLTSVKQSSRHSSVDSGSGKESEDSSKLQESLLVTQDDVAVMDGGGGSTPTVGSASGQRRPTTRGRVLAQKQQPSNQINPFYILDPHHDDSNHHPRPEESSTEDSCNSITGAAAVSLSAAVTAPTASNANDCSEIPDPVAQIAALTGSTAETDSIATIRKKLLSSGKTQQFSSKSGIPRRTSSIKSSSKAGSSKPNKPSGTGNARCSTNEGEERPFLEIVGAASGSSRNGNAIDLGSSNIGFPLQVPLDEHRHSANPSPHCSPRSIVSKGCDENANCESSGGATPVIAPPEID